MVPARLTAAEEQRWVTTMVERIARAERRRRPDDAELARRAYRLSTQYLSGRALPTSVRWVDNQRSRWGSCTPSDGSIRISSRLRQLPGYVLDYVIVHELAHLLARGHDRQFWDLVARYPQSERARGFLDGVAVAEQGRGAVPASDEDDDVVDGGDDDVDGVRDPQPRLM